mgnify:CR=1 FL=1
MNMLYSWVLQPNPQWRETSMARADWKEGGKKRVIKKQLTILSGLIENLWDTEYHYLAMGYKEVIWHQISL